MMHLMNYILQHYNMNECYSFDLYFRLNNVGRCNYYSSIHLGIGFHHHMMLNNFPNLHSLLYMLNHNSYEYYNFDFDLMLNNIDLCNYCNNIHLGIVFRLHMMLNNFPNFHIHLHMLMNNMNEYYSFDLHFQLSNIDHYSYCSNIHLGIVFRLHMMLNNLPNLHIHLHMLNHNNYVCYNFGLKLFYYNIHQCSYYSNNVLGIVFHLHMMLNNFPNY